MDIKEKSFSYQDMASIIYGEHHTFGCKEEVMLNGIITNDEINSYFTEMAPENTMKQKFMFLFEEKMYDVDDIPIGYGKIYIESDLCQLKGYYKI